MIKGTGVDIIDVARMKDAINKENRFVERIFTEDEIRYCETKFRREIHYSARFAAKEAFFKALGTGWRDGMKWTDISVRNDSLGKPEIQVTEKTLETFIGKGCSSIHLSLSHTHDQAVAFVVIE